MTARDAAERFARGSDRKIPPPPSRQEKAVEPQPPPRRIAPEEEEEIEPMYYPVERPSGQGCAGFVLQGLFLAALLGIVGVLAWWGMSTGRLDTPATAEQRPTARTIPTSAPAATRPPAPTADYEREIATYNQQQQARATELALQDLQEGPGATEAAPPDIPTLVPEWHAPMAIPADGIPDACATWHAPLPWPAECGAQEGWRVPLVRP